MTALRRETDRVFVTYCPSGLPAEPDNKTAIFFLLQYRGLEQEAL